MKQLRALGYIRISTKDQSTFSLDGQAEHITRHCHRQGIELIDIFRDDGQSAKNFDRANWREMERYIKANHRSVDYLLVMKFDRFSRNMREALEMMEKLENKYGIRVLSVMEPIATHPDSPTYFYMRSTMLLQSQVERMTISDRAKFGIHQGAISGYFHGRAPIGYTRVIGPDKKPQLLIAESDAALIQEVFRLFQSGVPREEIRRILKPRGLRISGNSAITRILTQPLYAGLIHVPKYYDDLERHVKGRHPGIVDESIWWQVQEKLTGRSIVRTTLNDEVPMRGVLRCPECGHVMSGGPSRNKRGTTYWYYLCGTHRKSFSALKLHAQFHAILQELSLPKPILNLLAQEVREDIEKGVKERDRKVADQRRALAGVKADILKLEEKYLRDQINQDTFNRWQSTYQGQRYSLEQDIATSERATAESWEAHYKEIMSLQHLATIYAEANVPTKQSLIRLLFESQLTYRDGTFQTPSLLTFFAPKAAALKEKGLLNVEQAFDLGTEFPLVLPGGERSNFFAEDLKLIEAYYLQNK